MTFHNVGRAADGSSATKVLVGEETGKKIVDRVNSYLSYEGRAVNGASTSEAVWQIKRIIIQGTQTTTSYAGNGGFDQIWDDRNALFTPGGFFNQLSVDFDGVNDYITCGDVYNYTEAQAFSTSIWIRPQNFAAQRWFIANVSNDGFVNGWRQGVNTTGKILTQMRTNGGSYAADEWPTALAADTWYHIVWTFSGSGNKSGQKVYINGALEAFTPGSGSLAGMTNGAYPLVIGQSGQNAGFFVGNLDECAIYNKTLSQDEVTEIYNSGSPNDLTTLTTAGNIQSWWRLGDDDTFPTVLDQNGVANGTMTNMAAADFESDVP